MYAILVFKVIEKGHYIRWLFVLKFKFKITKKKTLKVLEDILGLRPSVLGPVLGIGPLVLGLGLGLGTCGFVNITVGYCS